MIASLEPDPRSEEIGKAVGLDKTSSVSIGLFTDQERVAKEKELRHRVRRIEEAVVKSKKQT